MSGADLKFCEEGRESPFILGNLKVNHGERIHGILSLGEEEFLLPVTVICGVKPGKTVLITAGIHAGEYVGIQSAVELAEELRPEKTEGTVILVKVICREEFEQRAGSICPEDGKNLNREFPGRKEGTKMERLADAVTRELHSKADYYIDLHSGDDYEQLTPYVYYAGKAAPEVIAMSRKMAEQVDVPYMVKSEVASGGSYNYAASCGIPSILIERGGMGSRTMEEVESTKRDIRNVLSFLGIYRQKQDHHKYYPLDVREVRYQAASVSGLWYPQKKVGDLIAAGEVLGCVKDYEGKVREVCRCECNGVILYQTGSLQVLKDGPIIAYGQICYEQDDRKERITSYWTKRSAGFLEQRRAELHSRLTKRWLTEITAYLPKQKRLKVLDVGCGTGFFSILLAREGHQVTGIDLTPDMIGYAKVLAAEERADCKFQVMDAEHLDYADEEFDLVISRNLTWTLPEADKAYAEWVRVLKEGGILLNLDANYGGSDFADTTELPDNHAHHQIGDEMMQECEEIKRQLPISSYVRPAWDLEILGKIGITSFTIDLGISGRIYQEKDEFYNPTPMFLICGKKRQDKKER